MGDLTQPQQEALTQTNDFLSALEITQMTKSFKMLTLLAMLDENSFPGSISIEDLAKSFGRLAGRSGVLRQDVGEALNNPKDLIRLLETNPIKAWVGGRGTGDEVYFTYQNGTFSTRITLDPELRGPFQELVRELADWRFAEYLSRADRNISGPTQFTCKVSHSGDRAILFLPDREKHPQIPSGWVSVEANGHRYEANFVKVAVNVMREVNSEANLLHEILTQWFGPDAGRSGTDFNVVFEQSEDGFRMRKAAHLPK